MTQHVLSTADQVVTVSSQLVGLAVLAATLAGLVALGYRWLTRERVPAELALLAGLAGVAVYLNTTTVLGQVIDGELDTIEAALFNIGAFLLGATGALAGHRMGDAFGRDVLQDGSHESIDEDVSRLVKTVGRVTVVTMPEDVEDVVGYDLVSKRTREAIAGKQFVFPRNLTVAELDRRLRSRLKTDFGVGTVDLELTDDGRIEYLAVGSRAAGIGPTLPPATNAVALRADPAFAASTGDVVQVWEADSTNRVLTGELRGVADDVVTVAINSADTPKVDPTRTYRLVTLPVEDRPAREFASLLRAADESYTSVTVEAGSPLHGMPLGALDLTVVGVKPEGEKPVALPSREYVLSPGEAVYVIGLPDALRNLSDAATPLDPSLVPDTRESTGVRAIDAGKRAGEPSEGNQQGSDDAEEPSREQEGDGATDSPASEPSPTEQGDSESASVADTDAVADAGTPDDATATASAESNPETPAATDSPVAGRPDASSFEQLKEAYDEGEDWADEESDASGESESVEQVTESTASVDIGDVSENSDGTSFEDLKAEFESGDADWDESEEGAGEPPEEDGSDDEEVAFETDSEPGGEDDADSDLINLEDADISFDEAGEDDADQDTDDAAGGDAQKADSDLGDDFGEGFDENIDEDNSSLDGEDDLSSLTLEGEGESGLFDDDPFEDDDLFEEDAFDDVESVEDEEGTDDEETDEEKNEDDEDSSDGSGESSGGGSTFAQLKEEFESGEADWEDDISDSPGGDMRLDE